MSRQKLKNCQEGMNYSMLHYFYEDYDPVAASYIDVTSVGSIRPKISIKDRLRFTMVSCYC